jgi:hypothetical protein
MTAEEIRNKLNLPREAKHGTLATADTGTGARRMRHRKLLNLLARNAKKGEFRAESGKGNVDLRLRRDRRIRGRRRMVRRRRGRQLRQDAGGHERRRRAAHQLAWRRRVRRQGDGAGDARISGKITVHVDGYAASAATFLTSVADKTIMAPGSMLMIHKAWTIALGNADDFKATACCSTRSMARSPRPHTLPRPSAVGRTPRTSAR